MSIVSDFVSGSVLSIDWLHYNKVCWRFGQNQISIGNKQWTAQLHANMRNYDWLFKIKASQSVEISAFLEFNAPVRVVVNQFSKMNSDWLLCSQNTQIQKVYFWLDHYCPQISLMIYLFE